MKPTRFLIALCLGAMVNFPAFAGADSETATKVDDTVSSELERQAVKSRENLIAEAVQALDHSRQALTALDEKRIDDALDSLAISIGKLELVVARYPELALAPTGVSIQTNDVYGTKGAIEKAIKDANRMLDDGNVQGARQLLSSLGSEVIISTTNLPLATYPDAIKSISPLIDDGDIAEAKRKLQTTLNTLVVTNVVVPLPILRAEAMLTIAEALADQKARTEDQDKLLEQVVPAIGEQVELAELLGYGERKGYKPIYRQIRKLERSEFNPATFAELRDLLSAV